VKEQNAELPGPFDGRYPYWGAAADLAAILCLIAIGLTVWPMGGVEGYPAWVNPKDPLLEGPDSGNWAENIQHWLSGNYGDLEPHRMPTYVLFSGLTFAWTQDIPLSGHLVNHLAHLATPLCVYGIGRLMGSRVVGFGAGLLVALCPLLVEASERFGVDPTVAFMVPFSLFMALLAARWWWLGPLAGVVGGLAMTSHYTTLFHAIPPLIAILLYAKTWRDRLRSGAGYLVGVWVTWTLIFGTFVWGGSRVSTEAFHEALEKGTQEKASDGVSFVEVLWSKFTASDGLFSFWALHVEPAFHHTIQEMVEPLRSDLLPWSVAVLCVWIGFFGLGLGRIGDSKGWMSWLRLLDWKGGVVLLIALGPLPFLIHFHHAESELPLRYSYNFLPIVALVLVRGLVGPLLIVDRVVHRFQPKWKSGIFGLVLVCLLGRSYGSVNEEQNRQKPPTMAARASEQVGLAIKAEFEVIGGVVCRFRAAVPFTGGEQCPTSNRFDHYPMRLPAGEKIDLSDLEQKQRLFALNEGALWDYLAMLDEECAGDGPLPYVVVWRQGDKELVDKPFLKLAELWVRETWGVRRSVKVPPKEPHEIKAYIVSIPREDIRARNKDAAP